MKNLNLFRKSARGSEGSTLVSAVVRPSFDRRSTVVKHLAFMLLFLLGSLNVWGAEITYTFNSKSWDATSGGSAANWTSGKDGAGFSNNGIQVTTNASGANGTSPISFTNVTKVVCTYNTNASKGKGTIDVQVGTNDAKSVNWAYSGSASGTSANFTAVVNYSTPETGNVKITLNTTTNSIYLVSVTITTQSSNPEVNVSPASWDFGTVHASAEASKVFSVSGSNLTAGNLTLTVPDGFSVDPSSIAVDGTLAATNVTVSKNTSTEDDYAGNLSITGGGLESEKTVALTMTVDADPAPTGTFELYSGDITEGDYVICSGTTALKNELASNTNYIGYETVIVSENTITDPSDALIWHIAQSGEYWTIYNATADNYAASTGAKNKGQVIADGTDDKALWAASGTSSYEFVNKANTAASVNSNLRYNNGYGFACYGTGTGAALTLYKLSDGKEAAGLAYDDSDLSNLVKLGGTFTAPTLTNPNSLSVTYTSSNTDVVEVNASTGALTIKAVGVAEITASFAGNDDYKAGSAAYTIFVAEQAGTAGDPLTEASAKALIDLGCTLSAHVTGVAASQDATNYTITLSGGFEFYKTKDLNNVDFTSAYVSAGDKVTAFGQLTKFNSTYELANGCYLTSYTASTISKTHIANDQATAYTVAQALVYAADAVTYDLDDEVYVRGKVAVASTGLFSEKYLTYSISDDGTNENVLKVYNGLGVNGADFTSIDDIKVGEIVIVKGKLYDFKGTKELTDNELVWKKPVATIAIDNMALEFEEERTISATITPDAAVSTVSYSIKEGSDDCITLAAGKVTAKSVAGTATIIATIDATDDYEGATKEFTVTVAATDTRKVAVIDGITAVSGTLVTETAGSHKDKEYISYAALKGNAANAPAIPSGKSFVRIYQNGGYLAINAVKGCLIDEVIVSIPSDCNPTTIAVGTDEENLPTTGGSSATAGNNFSTGTGLNSQNVYLVCLGTDKNHRLEVGAITVKYNGDPISVKSIALSGEYQTEFTKNATFNHDGVVVTATYTDDSQADVTTLAEFSDPDMSTLGQKEITVSYGGKSTSYNIEVVAATLTEIALSGSYPTRFNMGDAFSHAGMTVTATYSDFSEEDVTASAIFSGYDMSVAGAQTVTVEFGGQSAEYQIIVVPENTDVLTADLIGVEGTSYVDWSDKTGFGTSSVYAGNSTNGSGANAGAIQLRYNASEEAKQAGIILTGSNGMVLKGFSVTVKSGSNTLNVYGKNTAYTSRLDLYSEDEATRGKLIGTVSATGALTLEEGVSYDDNYQYIGMRSNSGALYLSSIMITWGDATPEYKIVRSGLTAGNYYTICYNKKMTAIKGATLWSFIGKDASFAYLEEASAPFAAGKPYILYAESGKLEAVLEGDAVGASAIVANGAIHGTFADMDQAALTGAGDNIYLVIGNQLRRVDGQTGNSLPAYRAYVDLDEITGGAPSSMPGRKVRSMPMQGQTATGMDELNASETPVKMLINGQLFILRGEKMYDAKGQLVK